MPWAISADCRRGSRSGGNGSCRPSRGSSPPLCTSRSPPASSTSSQPALSTAIATAEAYSAAPPLLHHVRVAPDRVGAERLEQRHPLVQVVQRPPHPLG